ncbi:MAG: right-handed parallel beta-helix repeat-containing protein [Planctomycetota bacterium]
MDRFGEVAFSCLFIAVTAAASRVRAGEPPEDVPPGPEERQLARAMRSAMEEVPRVTVGVSGADIVGTDGRALQAAVDYVAGLGGGVVEIGEGTFLLRDSLHLRSHVTVRGRGEKTVLRKAAAAASRLALDGDYGEEQVTVEDPEGFDVGSGIAVWDDAAGGFHTTVARIVGRSGRRLALSVPLGADCLVERNAKAATVFPVVSAYHAEGAKLERVAIEGNREKNVPLNGCRGAGIFLYRAHGAEIRGCTVRGYNGDGMSFQQSNDVVVEDCIAEENAALGIHPGSGSQRPAVRRCAARRNGLDGLFLCWRVRHGVFEENALEANGRFGISIGHKDSDNLLRRNVVRANASSGIFIRKETLGMAAHRNRFEENRIEENGGEGVRIRGATRGLAFVRNRILDERAEGERTQKVGILIEEEVGEVALEGNEISAERPIVDRRERAPAREGL